LPGGSIDLVIFAGIALWLEDHAFYGIGMPSPTSAAGVVPTAVWEMKSDTEYDF